MPLRIHEGKNAIMWNARVRAALTRAGIAAGAFCVTALAASPAYACFDWGYTGISSYGWPYANAGFASYPATGYRSCGGIYHVPGWGECGGYGRCGWEPFPPVVISVPVTEWPGAGAGAIQPAVSRTADRRRVKPRRE